MELSKKIQELADELDELNNSGDDCKIEIDHIVFKLRKLAIDADADVDAD